MDKDQHCRLCKFDIKQDARHLPISKHRFSRDIKASLNLDVSSDDDSKTSAFICRLCQRKLERWRKQINNKKMAKINIDLNPSCSRSCTADPFWDEVKAEANRLELNVHEADGNTAFMKFDINSRELSHTITIHADKSWTAKMYRYAVLKDLEDFSSIPKTLDTMTAKTLFNVFFASSLCLGNTGFDDVCREKSKDALSEFKTVSGDIVAREIQCVFGRTVRHVKCKYVASASGQCSVCYSYRADLNVRRSRLKYGGDAFNMSSHHRNDLLTREELETKLKKMRAEKKTLKRKKEEMTDDINNIMRAQGVDIASNMGKSFSEILCTDEVGKNFEEGTPMRLLWEQQMEFQRVKDPRRMRWHPAMIRWCIALHSKSPAAYKTIRTSKFLCLPHEATLRDYTQFTKATVGINPGSVSRLVEDHDLQKCHDFQKNVALLFDEVKIKSGLVFKDGQLIGFCNLGSVNDELVRLERAMSDKHGPPEEATLILTIMVRSIFSRMEAVIAHYPSVGFTSYQLYWVIWDAVAVAEAIGLKVRALVSDGASPNRKFYRHIAGNNQFYTINRFASDRRRLFLICDVPHLMKTTRNNWENSGWNGNTRHLHYNGQDITWNQLVRLVEEDIGTGGLRLLPRISHEHLFLTPSLRMKVKLAAQVLSSSVCNAFELVGRHDTKSTEMFIRKMDMFFDCLNVSNIKSGRHSRKPALEPYKHESDWRFKWLTEDFLPWLDDWENQCQNKPNTTKDMKRRMCLSRETLEGLRITVKSFVAVTQLLVQEPGVDYLLSEKFSQDPLEEYFSMQRGLGGRNDNPTVADFRRNILRLQVARSPRVLASVHGNCTRNNVPMNMCARPMPRRDNR